MYLILRGGRTFLFDNINGGMYKILELEVSFVLGVDGSQVEGDVLHERGTQYINTTMVNAYLILKILVYTEETRTEKKHNLYLPASISPLHKAQPFQESKLKIRDIIHSYLYTVPLV